MSESEAGREQEPKNLASFLAVVLKTTYVSTPMPDLRFDRDVLKRISAPDGKKHLKFMAEHPWTNIPRMGGKRIDPHGALANYPDYVDTLENESKENVSKYIVGRRAFRQFMTAHSDVLDYIAILAENKEWETETPPENVVFETFQRLSKSPIMGELEVDPEEVEVGSILARIVGNAANRHALKIGQNPDEYLSRVLSKDIK